MNSLIKNGVVVAVILLFVSVSVIPSTGTTVVNKPTISTLHDGNTLYVGGNGSGNYTKIQDAINDAWYGDTVFVYDDSSPYYENLQIKRGINLIGEDKNTTVIDGNKQDSVIEILNDDVMVSGFTIWNCKMSLNVFDFAVVKVPSYQNITISDNIISIGGESEYHDWTAAIYLSGSTDCSILDNYIFEEHFKFRTTGILLDSGSYYNLVSGNTIAEQYIEGIWTNYNCFNNIISENYIHHNNIGIRMRGSDNEVINNRIVNNSGMGIYITDGQHTTVSGNIVSYNIRGLWDGGIVVVGSNKNIVSGNEISYNRPMGLFLLASYDNVIIRNNFIDNEGEGYIEKGNAFFTNEERRFLHGNVWIRNYWSDSLTGGMLPKIIHGKIWLLISYRPWINFDFLPARELYDIGV